LRGRHRVERFARGIEAAKAQRGGREIELAIHVVRFKPRDLRAPRHRLRLILFFARLRQNAEGRERIVMKLQNFARRARGAVEIFLRHKRAGAFEKIGFAPAAIRLRTVGEQDPTEGEPKEQRRRANRQTRGSEFQLSAADSLHAAPPPDTSNMLCHCGLLCVQACGIATVGTADTPAHDRDLAHDPF